MARLRIAALLCLLPSTALADRVPPPPADCPRGSIGETSHAGPICAPSTCAGPADCSGDTPSCVEVALCVESQTYTSGGIESDGQPRQRDVARGPCIDGRCPGGGQCQTARRCVEFEGERAPREEPAPEAPLRETTTEASETGDGGGGGCRAARGGRGGSAAILGLALLALLGRRRGGISRQAREGAKNTKESGR